MLNKFEIIGIVWFVCLFFLLTFLAKHYQAQRDEALEKIKALETTITISSELSKQKEIELRKHEQEALEVAKQNENNMNNIMILGWPEGLCIIFLQMDCCLQGN